MKVKFEKIDRSYYDDKKDEIVLREELLQNKEELSRILEHEITHARLRNRFLSILLDYSFIFLIIEFCVLFFLFYSTDVSLRDNLNKVIIELSKCRNPSLFINKTLQNITQYNISIPNITSY